MQRKRVGRILGTVMVSSMALSLIGCLSKPGNLVTPDREVQATQAQPKNPPNDPITAKKELVITDLSVVEDPVRTKGTGVWTFGTLMTRMANGRDPEKFVRDWLTTWTVDQTVNGDLVKNKKVGMDHVIALWPKTPDGKLDLTKAPFRLAAIVNRVDLRRPGNAGEGRFVFHYVEKDNIAVAGAPNSKPGDDRAVFTVIFEYGISDDMIIRSFQGKTPPKLEQGQNQMAAQNRMKAVADWASRWHRLSRMPYGPGYNVELQKITDVFSGANANPAKPNGSALNQLRTNEIQLGLQGAFGPGGDPTTLPVWELREFHVMPSGKLENVPMALTPKISLNHTTELGDYINQNEEDILKDAHVMPVGMMAGSSLTPGAIGDPFLIWNAPNIAHANDARFKFAQNTCSGCHLIETGLDQPRTAQGGPTPFIAFMQVRPRRAGEEAVLSSFMTGADVTDPATGKIRHLNDVQRRVDDLQTILKFAITPTMPVTREMEAPFPTKVH
ncbi:MAG TPA: hypothetical protein V6D05_10575 [Stenomitos sp.]